MKQSVTNFKLPSRDRKELLVKLLNNNPPTKPATGQVAWEAMPQDVKEKLGLNTVAGAKRNSVLVAWLRQRGLVPRAGKKPTMTIKLNGAKPNSEPLPQQGRAALVKSIILQYCRKGKMHWKTEIFPAHPEWRTMLGADTDKGIKQLYWFSKCLLKKDDSLAHLRKPKRLKARAESEQATVGSAVASAAVDCTITGPGLSIQFSASLLPTILHTIAIAMTEGTKKGKRA